MLRLLIATCVWLDRAKDYRHQPTLAALEELIHEGEVRLILPWQAVHEFARNDACEEPPDASHGAPNTMPLVARLAAAGRGATTHILPCSTRTFQVASVIGYPGCSGAATWCSSTNQPRCDGGGLLTGTIGRSARAQLQQHYRQAAGHRPWPLPSI